MQRLLRVAALFVLACFLAGQAAAQDTLIDFEQFNAPSIFSSAQPPLTIGDATFSGGQLLEATTSLPANESVVYGSASPFCAGCMPTITIDFKLPVSNFSVNVTNGATVTVNYTVSDDEGGSQTLSLVANFASGSGTVNLPSTNIRQVEINSSAAIGCDCNWDFFIDNLRFTPASVPVVLVHGWCGDPSSFGQMENLLRGDGLNVESFDYSQDTQTKVGKPIENISEEFAGFVQQVMTKYDSSQVDVVAHSMGGLVAKAWVAGIAHTAYNNQIRRLVTIGTPHYGALGGAFNQAIYGFDDVKRRLGGTVCSGLEVQEMKFGSSFISRLNDHWRVADSLNKAIRPEDMLEIAGTVGRLTPTQHNPSLDCEQPEGCSDGLVDFASATTPDDRVAVRYVPYKHATIIPYPGDTLPEATIDFPQHKAFKLVEAFLKDGTVLDQYPDPDSVEYVPIFEATTAKNEGLVLVRAVEAGTSQNLDFKVTLYGQGGTYSEVTNPDTGFHTLWGVSQGTYILSVTAPGYSAQQLQITVTTGRPTVPPILQLSHK